MNSNGIIEIFEFDTHVEETLTDHNTYVITEAQAHPHMPTRALQMNTHT